MPRPWVGSLATLVSLIEVGVWIVAVERFDFSSGAIQLSQQHTWFKSLGVSYYVGQFGFSLVARRADGRLRGRRVCVRVVGRPRAAARAYFGLLLFLTGSVAGVFFAQDLLLFYAFFEAMLIPLYVLIGVWGGAGRLGATSRVHRLHRGRLAADAGGDHRLRPPAAHLLPAGHGGEQRTTGSSSASRSPSP